MHEYHRLLRTVYEQGEGRGDRTGTGTRSLFGCRMQFDLEARYPLLTTKKMFVDGIIDELLWMYVYGSTNINDLPERTQHWWDKWADEEGDLGPIYGKQARRWSKPRQFSNTNLYRLDAVDQIKQLIKNIRDKPYSRRHIVSLWNVADLDEMALPPCHGLIVQFYVRRGEYLDCQMYQRSADLFVGVPVNIASYAMLTHMLAQVTGYKAGKFSHIIGDAHVYSNHFDQTEELLSREPFPQPKLVLNQSVKCFDNFRHFDIEVVDYQHHPHIKAPVAV